MSSPIDAGRTRIALAAKAARMDRTAYIENGVEADSEEWVKGAGLALAAASAALDGDLAAAERWMKEAQRCETRVDEWRLPLLTAELRKGEAALVLMTQAERRPDAAALVQWADAAPADRTQAAAWVCAEWISRKGSASQDARFIPVLQAFSTYTAKLYPWDQLNFWAQAAAGVRKHGREKDVRAALERLFDPTQRGALSVEHFETAVTAARAWAGAGDRAEAERLLRLAEERLRRRETGDVPAPWMVFAEAQAEAGVPLETVKQTWLTGIEKSREQRGFYRSIARALTVGGMALSPCEWTQEEVSQICHTTEETAVVQK